MHVSNVVIIILSTKYIMWTIKGFNNIETRICSIIRKHIVIFEAEKIRP